MLMLSLVLVVDAGHGAGVCGCVWQEMVQCSAGVDGHHGDGVGKDIKCTHALLSLPLSLSTAGKYTY